MAEALKDELINTFLYDALMPKHKSCLPNYHGFEVIGAGLPRTGTTSIQAALEILLNGPCYHGAQLFEGTYEEINHFQKVLKGKVSDNDWINFLEGRGFRSGVSYTISHHFESLMRIFPNVKVVLTIRDPERWYESVKETIFDSRDPSWSRRCFLKIVGMFRLVNFVNMSHNEVNDINKRGLFDSIACGKGASVTFYNNWVRHVKNTVQPNRLLVFEPKQGWEPLCTFLNLPIPEVPFPHLNDTSNMRWTILKFNTIVYTTLYGIPILLATVIFFTMFC